MIIERIRIQRCIRHALKDSRKALNPLAVDIALKDLKVALKSLNQFNANHPFFSRLLKWIDQRFCLNPLNKAINRLQAKVVKAVAPILPPAVDHAADLQKAADAFRIKNQHCFDSDEVAVNYDVFLKKRSPEQTIVLLGRMDAFRDQHPEISESSEFFDDMISFSDSFETALKYLETREMSFNALSVMGIHHFQCTNELGQHLLDYFIRQLYEKSPETNNDKFTMVLTDMFEELDDIDHPLAPSYERVLKGFKLKSQLTNLLNLYGIDLFAHNSLTIWYRTRYFKMDANFRMKKFFPALEGLLKQLKDAPNKAKIIAVYINDLQKLVDHPEAK